MYTSIAHMERESAHARHKQRDGHTMTPSPHLCERQRLQVPLCAQLQRAAIVVHINRLVDGLELARADVGHGERRMQEIKTCTGIMWAMPT